MRKTFRKRINLATLRQQGIQKSNVMLDVYISEAFDKMEKGVIDFYDRVLGGDKWLTH